MNRKKQNSFIRPNIIELVVCYLVN